MNDEKKERIITIIRLVLGLTLSLLGLFWLNEANFGVWVNFTVMAVAWLLVGYDIRDKAFRALIYEMNPLY